MSLFDKFSDLKSVNLDDVYNAFLGLDRRGQVFAGSGLVVFLLVILFLPASCVSSRLGAKETEYLEHVDKAAEVYSVLAEYNRLQKAFETTDAGSSSGTDVLQNLIYDMAENVGIDLKENRVEVKTAKLASNELYEEVGKDVSMSRVPLEQVLSFMERVQGYEDLPLTIKKMNLRVNPRKRDEFRQAKFTVTTIRLNR